MKFLSLLSFHPNEPPNWLQTLSGLSLPVTGSGTLCENGSRACVRSLRRKKNRLPCGSFDPEAGSQPAHVGRGRGAGAKAETVLPLCDPCHDWEHEDAPAFDQAFFDRHEVWPWEMAAFRYTSFHEIPNRL